MDEDLKKPSDYPPMYFRTTEANKKAIDQLIDQILEHRIDNQREGKKLPKRNALMAEALLIGLEQIKRKIKKS